MLVPSGKLSFVFATIVLALLSVAIIVPTPAFAQASTGAIRGAITDQSGAVLPAVTVTVRNVDTNTERRITTNAEGLYNADNLRPGDYEITVEAQGFKKSTQQLAVLTGNTHTANFSLVIGSSSESVLVTAEAPQINLTDYKIDGVITRERVDTLPLNGRNFLELAQIAPGVTVTTTNNPGALANSFTQVSIGGVSGALTQINVDGANVNDRVTGGSATNFSQEMVQEFQITTFNFDLSNDTTSIGSVNVVSRTGTNTLHGSGFFYFRDHNMSAYPNLVRSAAVPDPFFVRRQSGFSLGGPAIKDKLFWFTNYEYSNLVAVREIAFSQTAGDGGNFARTFNHIGRGPLQQKLFNARLDYRINSRHSAFARYSQDLNHSVQINTNNESTGVTGRNQAYNAVLGVTSVLTPALVNDVRLNYNLLTSALAALSPDDCGGTIGCLNLGGPNIAIGGILSSGGTSFALGTASGVPTDRANRTYQLTDGLSWQKGTHRLRFGGEFERYVRFGSTATSDTGTLTVFGPDQVRTLSPALYAALPATLKSSTAGPVSFNDMLALPVNTFAIGVGDYSSPAPFNRESARRSDRYRVYIQDGWQIRQNFTLNYGLAWSLDTNIRNYDLPRPKYLAPILAGNLSVPPHEYKDFSPALGFAWAIGKQKKTVIRAGSGLYFDSDTGASRIAERRILGPAGNGRVVIDGTGILNPLSSQTGQPVTLSPGAAGVPSALTLGQALAILPGVKATEEARFGRLGDLTVQNIALLKSNATQPIFSPDTRTPYSIHVTAGVQRELARNFALTVDFTMRRGVAYGGVFSQFSVDLNRFNAVRVLSTDPVTQVPTTVTERVIPVCQGATTAATIALRNDPNAQCSVGSLSVYQSAANSRYVGMDIILDKRFSKGFQFSVSYAMSRYQSWNDPVINLNNWQESYGTNDNDRRHRMNINGIWQVPHYNGAQPLVRALANNWQISTVTSFVSSPPMNPSLSTIDVDGDGISFTRLPGIDWNGFGRGSSADDIRKAVDKWNADVISRSIPLPANPTAPQIAACTLTLPNGQKACAPRTPRNQVYPLLTLPTNFANGDKLLTTDLRLTRTIVIAERLRMSIIGEGFNIFNISNLGGYSANLQSTSFGIPTTRVNQIFGSGGPRAFQVAARLTF
jgi:carboxypeptidase family protein